jgi:hypothetical protein
MTRTNLGRRQMLRMAAGSVASVFVRRSRALAALPKRPVCHSTGPSWRRAIERLIVSEKIHPQHHHHCTGHPYAIIAIALV